MIHTAAINTFPASGVLEKILLQLQEATVTLRLQRYTWVAYAFIYALAPHSA